MWPASGRLRNNAFAIDDRTYQKIFDSAPQHIPSRLLRRSRLEREPPENGGRAESRPALPCRAWKTGFQVKRQAVHQTPLVLESHISCIRQHSFRVWTF